MALPSDLVSQFVKVTNDKTEIKTETTVNGTIVEYEGKKYVRIDGSDLLTPYETTTDVENGERVKVMIKNHTATVTGNVSSPSARTDTVKEVGEKADEASSKISEFEIIIADKVSVDELDAVNGRIDNLVSDNVTIKGELDAHKATIDTLTADNVTINESLTAQSATIENLKTTKLDAEVADITYATITNLDATNATIHNLEATYGDFQVLTTDKFAAIDADIKNLETEKLSAESAELRYANIDFANIGEAAIENFYAKSGVIQDVVISEGQVTGTLVGVTIKGDLIEGGTIVADKLVIQGEDGLYYKLNTNGETVTSQQTEYNSLSGTIITAKSVTAEKIAVDDLVAFDATIGGFNITDHAIYSGVKESVENTTRGIYLDNYGQIAFGDASNYVKFYKGDDEQYHLAIAAEDMVISSSNKNVGDEIDEAQRKADAAITKSVEEFYQSTSPTELVGGSWSLVQPTWADGTYIWRRTKNTYGSGKIEYSPSETGVCITGNTGAQGLQGLQGEKGEQGIQGPKGDTGEKGESGAAGADGKTSYFHIKYSEVANPTSSSQMTETPSTYIGTYVDYTPADSTDPSKYTWSRFQGLQGETGEQGIPGTNGENGKTSYLHIKYSNDGGNTFTSNNGETPGDYIGQYVDFTQADSTNVSAYTWSKVKGETGEKGDQGEQGPKGEKGDTGASGTGYTVLLTNESHTFPGSTSAATASSASTKVIAYKNTTQVSATITKIGNTPVSGNASGIATGVTGLTATVTNNGTNSCSIQFDATASLTTKSGSITVTIAVDGQSFTKNFSFSLSLTGATGAAGGTGAAAKAVDIVASSQVFKSTDGGKTFSPDTIKLTPAFQGGLTYSKWKYSTDGGTNWSNVGSGSNGLTISNSVLTISKDSALYTDEITAVSFKCVGNDSTYTDTVTVVKLYDVTDLEIGGRNYVRNSKNLSSFQLESGGHVTAEVSDESITITRVDSGSWYGIYYDLDILPDTEYTFSFEVLSTTGKCYCDIGKGASFTSTIGRIIFSDAGKKSITFTTPSDITAIRLYISMPDQDVVAVICNAKLELGNVATDWTPAPEDVDQKIEDTEASLQVIISEQETTISKNNEEILLQALTGYVGQDEFGEYKETVSSQFSQSSEEIEMKFTDVRSDVQETADGLETVNTNLTKYFTFSDNGLTIKGGDGEMQLRLDNDVVRFFKNGKEFGWWDGVDFHTGNIYVDVYERAQFGNFAFVPRSDGSLSFLKVDDYKMVIITKQPVSQKVAAGTPVSFTVEATGSIRKYGWQHRRYGVVSTEYGSTSNTLTFSNPTSKINGYEYRAAITDKKGHVIYSDWAKLTVSS